MKRSPAASSVSSPAASKSVISSSMDLLHSSLSSITSGFGDSVSNMQRSSSSRSLTSLGSIYEEADAMAPTMDDLTGLIDDENFRALQKALRTRGCVTNNYLQQNIHLYVQHVRSKRLQQQQEEQEQQLPTYRRCGTN